MENVNILDYSVVLPGTVEGEGDVVKQKAIFKELCQKPSLEETPSEGFQHVLVSPACLLLALRDMHATSAYRRKKPVTQDLKHFL